MADFFRKYLLPGLVFQSIVIGGGYGTGRELVEFFLTEGPAGGYLGMLVATLLWGLFLSLGFDLARLGRHYDYRTFLGALLGPGWMAFEGLYVAAVILTTAVVGSASGELLHASLGWPRLTGTLIMVALVAILTYSGTGLIERFFAVWSFALYAVYLTLIVLVWRQSSSTIAENALVWTEDSSWLIAGARYAAYNLGAMPAMLFALRPISTRREAFGAGILAAVIAMFPGVLVYSAFLAHYPEITEQAIPANFVLSGLDMPWFQLLFQIILFGTFIETGTGLIHGFNERIAGVLAERGRQMTHRHRLAIASGLMVGAIWLADRFGLITLIGRGYGLITWGFWLLFLLPILVVGSKRILADVRASG